MTTPTPTPVVFPPVELPSKYAKAIVAILTSVLTVFAAAMTDGKVTTLELANIAIAFLTAFLVYAVPNFQQNVGAWAKALVAVLGAALQALVPFLVNGTVTPAQWLLVLLAGIGALGVGIVPNVNPAALAEQRARALVALLPAAPVQGNQTLL